MFKIRFPSADSLQSVHTNNLNRIEFLNASKFSRYLAYFVIIRHNIVEKVKIWKIIHMFLELFKILVFCYNKWKTRRLTFDEDSIVSWISKNSVKSDVSFIGWNFIDYLRTTKFDTTVEQQMLLVSVLMLTIQTSASVQLFTALPELSMPNVKQALWTKRLVRQSVLGQLTRHFKASIFSSRIFPEFNICHAKIPIIV